MQTAECEAIVLAAMDYGEADRIVTLFTREFGKVRGIARNGKKSVKRFGAALEIFARLRLRLVLKEGLCSLRNADVMTVFPHIRTDLSKIGYAGYACEVVDRFLPEAQCNSRLYRLLSAYLEYLDTFPAAADDRRFFEVNLLNIVGYRLSLDRCEWCGAGVASVLDGASFATTAKQVCDVCGRSWLSLSSATLDILRRAMETGRFGVIRFSPETLHEAGEILDTAIAAHLNRPLTSLLFLRDVLVVH
jgi:DNA repair protein RecO (recombination protein O)